MANDVVITGTGMVTALGTEPSRILSGINRRVSAVGTRPFEMPDCTCPLGAPIVDFDAREYFPENKTLRLMNRDAQLAVVAARLAMQDSQIQSDITYPSQDIALYGATGVTSLGFDDISSLISHCGAEDGSLDLHRFGKVALKRIRPVLSFKILANMPICFVSIFEKIRGPNAVFTPWQGQGLHAIATAIDAVANGEVPCALVGGCDVRTSLLSYINLQQLGVFDSWSEHGNGTVPSEGACFVVLENRKHAMARSARIYARIADCIVQSTNGKSELNESLTQTLKSINPSNKTHFIASGDGDIDICAAEQAAISHVNLDPENMTAPKLFLGNTFAAAAPLQLALACHVIQTGTSETVLANCFGHGTEQGTILLEAA